MSEDSEVGIVLANAPRLERAFGRKLAAVITLIGLYFARRRPGLLGLLASLHFVVALALQVWLKFRG
jgi:hypothetical protein